MYTLDKKKEEKGKHGVKEQKENERKKEEKLKRSKHALWAQAESPEDKVAFLLVRSVL